jgi:hypothetical protein
VDMGVEDEEGLGGEEEEEGVHAVCT